MPEIAEVETVRRTLKKQILHQKIEYIKILYPKMIEKDSLDLNLLIDQEVNNISRLGKWLIFNLTNYDLISHLRMEGKFFIKDKKDELNKHEHIIIGFKDFELRYHDTRKFGKMALLNKRDTYNYKALAKQGLEPNDSKLTKEYLFDKIHNSNIAIKTLLLDQTIISGLGNIYANEVLFSARINPQRKGASITIKECDKIIESANKIIKEAISLGGTTIKSYTSSLGVTGRFQQKLMVHKRENEPCKICNTSIINEKVNGRSTYYCPKCQNKKV